MMVLLESNGFAGDLLGTSLCHSILVSDLYYPAVGLKVPLL